MTEKQEMFLNALKGLEKAKDEFQCMLSSVSNSMSPEQNEAISEIRQAYSKTLGCYQALVSGRSE